MRKLRSKKIIELGQSVNKKDNKIIKIGLSTLILAKCFKFKIVLLIWWKNYVKSTVIVIEKMILYSVCLRLNLMKEKSMLILSLHFVVKACLKNNYTLKMIVRSSCEVIITTPVAFTIKCSTVINSVPHGTPL